MASSEEVRNRWVAAWGEINHIVTEEWMKLNYDCCELAAKTIGGTFLTRLVSKAWTSGKQGHGR